MVLYIKNMMGERCKKFVKEIFDLMNIPYVKVDLGWVETVFDVKKRELEELDALLKEYYLEFIFRKNEKIVERIKTYVYETLLNLELLDEGCYAAHLSEKLGYDYHYLGKLFKEETSVTLHQYIIMQKVAKAKILLLDKTLRIKEIAYLLNYSNIGHFSKQFKQYEHISPSVYRNTFFLTNY